MPDARLLVGRFFDVPEVAVVGIGIDRRPAHLGQPVLSVIAKAEGVGAQHPGDHVAVGVVPIILHAIERLNGVGVAGREAVGSHTGQPGQAAQAVVGVGLLVVDAVQPQRAACGLGRVQTIQVIIGEGLRLRVSLPCSRRSPGCFRLDLRRRPAWCHSWCRSADLAARWGWYMCCS